MMPQNNYNTDMLKYHYKFKCHDCGFSYESHEDFIPQKCCRHNCQSYNISVMELPKENNNEKNQVRAS